MKTFGTIMKILVTLAAIAGAIYVAATYGDKIVAWCKMTVSKIRACSCCSCCCEEDVLTAEEIAVDEAPVQAEEADFEG